MDSTEKNIIEKDMAGKNTGDGAKSGAVFYLTTPIYYVNDVPHIGHAYTTIACDALARWHRARGDDTRFLTGTDEHGQKIEQAAEQRGKTPIGLCDDVVTNFKKLWNVLCVSNDDFIRTTESRHIETARYIFARLIESGDIYKGTYEGWYCVPCETYVPDAQAGGGKTCPDCGRPLTRMSDESYFFRLSKYQDALINYYEARPDAIMPKSRYNEAMSFIRGGLRDASVSRTALKWGIAVPGDERHTMYVWLDALVNYLSAAGYPNPGGAWESFWPHVHHVVGKDIIRFHSVIWPAVLMAMGLNPPARVFAHGWWTVDGDKMSKSKGNAVDPFEMAEIYGADAFRYFLLREVPFGGDGDFSEPAMVSRINSDLANDIGNLLNRALQMIEKYRGGNLPPASALSRASGVDSALRALAADTLREMDSQMEAFSPDGALKTLWTLIGAGNKYIDETAPWKLGKDDPDDRLDVVLRTLWEVLALSSALVCPFMPDTAARMRAQLGIDGDINAERFADWKWGGHSGAVAVKKGDVLFPRIDAAKWKENYDARRKTRIDAQRVEVSDMDATYDMNHKPQIEIDDFKKLEIRVARIESAEAVKDAGKLYKISLDLGFEKRVIVSSIREFFTPDQLTGKKILVLCNLKPAKFRGTESNGMLLAAEADDGSGEIISLATVDDSFPVGAPVC